MHAQSSRWAIPLLLMLTATGCALPSNLTPTGTPSPDPLTAPATAPTSAPGALVLTPQPAFTTTAPPEQVRTSVPWTLQVLSADGTHATIGYQSSGGCTEVTGVQVDQSPTSVQLTVWAETSGHFNCTVERKDTSVVVTLNPPLGHRPLLHAPVSRGLATP